MNVLDKVMDIKIVETQIVELQENLSTQKIELLKKLNEVVYVFSTYWNDCKKDVANKLNLLIEENNVQYSKIKNDQYSLEGLMWEIGNYVPLFSDAGELITDYEIVRDDSNIIVYVKNDVYHLQITYEGQDGFEMALPEQVWKYFENENAPEFERNIKQYMESQIQKAFKEIEKKIIPKMDKVSKNNSKINKMELEKQAAALGLKLVPQ